jgi:hypothetical protein
MYVGSSWWLFPLVARLNKLDSASTTLLVANTTQHMDLVDLYRNATLHHSWATTYGITTTLATWTSHPPSPCSARNKRAYHASTAGAGCGAVTK